MAEDDPKLLILLPQPELNTKSTELQVWDLKADAYDFVLFEIEPSYCSTWPGTGYVIQAGLQIAAILAQPPEYRDCTVTVCLAKATA